VQHDDGSATSDSTNHTADSSCHQLPIRRIINCRFVVLSGCRFVDTPTADSLKPAHAAMSRCLLLEPLIGCRARATGLAAWFVRGPASDVRGPTGAVRALRIGREFSGFVKTGTLSAFLHWLLEGVAMHRSSLVHVALFAVLALTTACGGAPKPAESPAESSSSSASSDSSSAASSTDAQLPESAIGKGDDAKTASSAPAPKPETSSAAEDAIVSGNALPPSPMGAGTASNSKTPKSTKAKKPAKGSKKSAQASR